MNILQTEKNSKRSEKMKKMTKEERQKEFLEICRKGIENLSALDFERLEELSGIICPICEKEIFKTETDYYPIDFEGKTFMTCSFECAEKLKDRLNSASHRFSDKNYYP